MFRILFHILLLMIMTAGLWSQTVTGEVPEYDPDWEDLEENHKFYGSEKDEKFPVRAIVLTIENWPEHYTLTAFWLFRYRMYPKYKAVRFFPFYSSKQSRVDDRRKWQFLNMFSKKDGYADSFLFFPFYYKRDHHIRRDRTVIVAPFNYYYSQKTETFEKKKHFSWLHYYDSVEGSYSYSTFFMPIIPLYYRHKSDDSYHLNLLWMFDFYRSDSERHNWFLPLLAYGESGSDSYKSDYFMLAPFYYGADSEYPSSESRFSFTPLYYYSKQRNHTVSREGQGSTGSTIAVPLLPLFYYSSDKYTDNGVTETASHTNLLWLIDYSHDNGQLDRFWLLPFYFYRSEQYHAVLPFYWHTVEGSTASPFFYKEEAENSRTFWLLLYYNSEKYRHDNKQKIEKKLNIWAPVYLNYKSPYSRTGLFLPFYYTHESARKYIHLNISGLSLFEEFGRFRTPVMLNREKVDDETKWYLDTDISWFYALFTYRSRTPIPESEAWPDDKIEAGLKELIYDEPPEPPEKSDLTENEDAFIENRSIFDKKNAESYWSTSFLFGLYAVERVDERRHFRAMPLAWLSWVPGEDDDLYVTPLFFYYTEKETSYFATLPLPVYGSMVSEKGYLKAYGIILFYDEYDAEKEQVEKTFLWPLVNFYSAPGQSGSRFLPFYYYRYRMNEGSEKSDFYSLFYMSGSVRKDNYENRYRAAPLLPVFYYSSYYANDDSSEETTVLPALLYYGSEEISTNSYRKRVFNPLYFDMVSRYGTGSDNYSQGTYILPLLFFYGRTENNSYSATSYNWLLLSGMNFSDDGESHSRYLLPVYYRSYDSYSSVHYWFGFFHEESDYSSYSNFLLLSSYENYKHEDKQRFCLLLCTTSLELENGEVDLISFFYLGGHYETYQNEYSMNLSLLYFQGEDSYSFYSALVPVYYYSSTDSGSFHISLPLLSYSDSETGYSYELVGLGLLWYRDYVEGYDSDTYLLSGTLYRYNYRRERDYSSWGSFWGYLWEYEIERETGFSKFSIFKFLYSRTVKNGRVKNRMLGFIPLPSF